MLFHILPHSLLSSGSPASAPPFLVVVVVVVVFHFRALGQSHGNNVMIAFTV
jgi:hypothetical protein